MMSKRLAKKVLFQVSRESAAYAAKWDAQSFHGTRKYAPHDIGRAMVRVLRMGIDDRIATFRKAGHIAAGKVA